MNIKDKSISAWQLGILIFILIFANKILLLPSLLYDGAKMEAFIIPIVLFVFEMGILFLFYKLKTKYPNESICFLIKKHFGRVVSIFLFVLVMLFFLCKSVLLYNIAYIFFRTLIYKESNNILFLFCFLPVVNYLAVSGLRVMGRTAQLFFPVIIVVTLFCIVIGLFGINTTPLFFEASFSDVLTTTLRHISAFGDLIFLFVVMDKVSIKKGQWKVVFSLAGISMVVVCVITTIFIFSYTYTSFMHPYALFEIMNYVQDYGGLGRIDIVSMVLIIIFTYFHLSIYLKAFIISFNFVFEKIDVIYSVLTFNIIFVLIVNFLILNLEKSLVYGEGVLPYFAIVSHIIIPLFVTILLIDRKKKRSNNL